MIYFYYGILIWFAYKENKNEKKLLFVCVCLLSVILINKSYEVETIWSVVIMIVIIISKEVDCKNSIIQMLIERVNKYSYEIYLLHPLIIMLIVKCIKVDKVIQSVILVSATIIMSISIQGAWKLILNRIVHVKRE